MVEEEASVLMKLLAVWVNLQQVIVKTSNCAEPVYFLRNSTYQGVQVIKINSKPFFPKANAVQTLTHLDLTFNAHQTSVLWTPIYSHRLLILSPKFSNHFLQYYIYYRLL